MGPSEKTAFVWGPDELMELPRRGLVELGVPPESLPEDDWVPKGMARIYDAEGVPEPLRPFSVIQLRTGDITVTDKLVVLGSVPATPDLLYVLEPGTGEVLQFDRETNGVRGVNSAYRWFTEFLWRLGAAKREAAAGSIAEVLTPGLRATLETVDPLAFQDTQWWPTVWSELGPRAGGA